MPKKIYAVRHGKVTGLFTEWDACRESVQGVPGAEYRSFRSRKEAEAYLAGEDALSSPVPDTLPAGEVEAYVDGSFDAGTGRYGYGCVLRTATDGTVFLNGSGDDPSAATARNVAGELLGTMAAVRWAAAHGYRTVRIYHDYSGIAAWYTGEWKASSDVAKRYLAYLEPFRTRMNLTFHKVRAHTGVEHNEEADRLAKEALGIKK